MHRPRALTHLLVAASFALAACTATPAPQADPSPTPTAPTPAPSAAATTDAPSPSEVASCEPDTAVPIQGGGHLLGGQPPPGDYNSVPPTSGWHASGEPKFGLHPEDRPLSEPEQVSVLELGGIVITYSEVAPGDLLALHTLPSEHERIAVTPYDRLPAGAVALTAWGRLQRCTGYDAAAVEAFIDAHLGRGADGAH